MKLTGKTKKDFEEWLLKTKDYDNLISINSYLKGLAVFKLLSQSMQWGVYQDFFLETKNWYIHIRPRSYSKNRFSICITGSALHILTEQVYTETLPKARIKAIEIANELFNSKHKEDG